jgi:hypothetical protein
VSDDRLLAVLRDPQTTDAAWLRAFRAWAVAHLLERGAKPAAGSRAPRKKEA